MNPYQQCTPARGCDGRWYVASDYSDRFQATHLDFERRRGNLREVELVRVVNREEEIEPGDLVCFGATRVSVWREIKTEK